MRILINLPNVCIRATVSRSDPFADHNTRPKLGRREFYIICYFQMARPCKIGWRIIPLKGDRHVELYVFKINLRYKIISSDKHISPLMSLFAFKVNITHIIISGSAVLNISHYWNLALWLVSQISDRWLVVAYIEGKVSCQWDCPTNEIRRSSVYFVYVDFRVF